MRTSRPLVVAALAAGSSPSTPKMTSSIKPAHIPTECVIAGIPYWETNSDDVSPRQPLPTRDEDDGSLVFESHETFRPNLSPQQVLQAGSFGGTYYRPITSRVAKCKFDVGTHLEFPPEWFQGLDIKKTVTSEIYRKDVNKYGVKSGNDLNFWETKGWMRAQDPYGWFQWYCRYYLGRRTKDDDRQVSRWVKAIGVKGRWRTFLVGQCVKSGKEWDDFTASPVTRQTLLHWGYELRKPEFDRLAPPIRKGKSVIYLGKVSNADKTESKSGPRSIISTRNSSKRQRKS